MSIPVDLVDLPKTLQDFDRGYLLTTTEGRVKAVSVRAVAVDGVLRVATPGRGSVANVGANPTVTTVPERDLELHRVSSLLVLVGRFLRLVEQVQVVRGHEQRRDRVLDQLDAPA